MQENSVNTDVEKRYESDLQSGGPHLNATDVLPKNEDSLNLNSVINKWSTCSLLEKCLIVSLFFAVLFSIILLIILTSENSTNSSSENTSSTFLASNLSSGYAVKEDGSSISICEHRECTIAASDILLALDESLDPCDDFVKFSCGGWKSLNPVPEDSPKWNQFSVITRRLNVILSSILENPINESDYRAINKAKKFYAGCLNETRLETIGLTPLIEFISPFGNWPISNVQWSEEDFDWLTTVAETRKQIGFNILLDSDVRPDWRDTSRNVIYIDQPKLILPRSVLLEPDKYKERITAYKSYIKSAAKYFSEHLKTTLTEQNLTKDVDDLYNFETALANITSREEDRRDVKNVYHKMTVENLMTLASNDYNIDFLKYLNIIFSSVNTTITNDTDVIVMEVNYIKNLFKLIQETDKRTISNYIIWRQVKKFGDETTMGMREISLTYMKIAHGVKSMEPRAVLCGEASNTEFGMAIGMKYTEMYFTKDTKRTADKMIENIQLAFKEMLGDNDWMDEETRRLSEEKADYIAKFIGYPDWFEDQEGLDKYYINLENIDEQTHFQNIVALRYFRSTEYLQYLNEPVDRKKWSTTPAIVNAFYEPVFNSIVFPAAILQPPFYRTTAPEYLNYGGIGQVIGHEIIHGFDDQGRQYNKDGNAIEWWSDDTSKKFINKTQCIIDQYQNFRIPELDEKFENASVNGQLTQGENIADSGGLRAAFYAYLKFVEKNGEEPRLPGLSHYTPQQLFFIANAQIWCSSSTKEALLNQILTDPHAPAPFRIIGPIANMKEFAEVWKCPSETTMNPKKRCKVW